MVKKKNNGKTETAAEETPKRPPTSKEPAKHAAPAGYEEQSTNVIGFWDIESGPIHCIPRYAKLFDGNLDKTKPAILIFAQLVDAIEVTSSEEEDETVQAAVGDLVGIWGKPGMAPIKNLANVPVFMYLNGEIDTGKPNPMKVFKVMAKEKGGRLPISEDLRRKSKHVATFLTPDGSSPAAQGARAPQLSDNEGLADVPF